MENEAIQEATTQQPAAESTTPAEETQPESKLPDISKNLFWDDTRIGFQVIGFGALIVLLGLFAVGFGVDMAGGIITLIGLLVLVAGTKIACAMSEEISSGWFVFAALGLVKLSLLAFLVSMFLPDSLLEFLLSLSSLGLMFASLVCFALAFSGGFKYLEQPVLASRSMVFLIVVAVGALSLIVSSVLIPGVIFGGLAYLSFEMAQVIKQVQLGSTEEKAGEEEDLTDEEVAHAPEGTDVFPQEVQNKLHAEDNSAGRAIVVLMTAVFSVGVVLYAIIAVLAS